MAYFDSWWELDRNTLMKIAPNNHSTIRHFKDTPLTVQCEGERGGVIHTQLLDKTHQAALEWYQRLNQSKPEKAKYCLNSRSHRIGEFVNYFNKGNHSKENIAKYEI